jgi:hypothetical protein
MRPVLIGRVLAGGRVLFGAALIAVPERFTTPWIGADAARDGSRLLSSAIGARDLVLGAGALGCSSEAQLAPWLLAGVGADAIDCLATVGAGRSVPLRGRVLVGSLAAAGAVAGTAALAGLKRASD